MTGFTSSSKTTRSPMTIASTPGFSPGVNAAHEVSPMKGGTLFQPSTETGKSLRGNETLTTLSELSGLPPVAAPTAPGSIALGLLALAPFCAAVLALVGGVAACAVDEHPLAKPPSSARAPANIIA